MSKFQDSYETTVGSAVDLKRTKIAIQESIIKDGLKDRDLKVVKIGEWQPLFITGTRSSEAEIPLFTHPITILTHTREKVLCGDLRLFVRKDTPIDNIWSGVKNLTEFNFAYQRSILSLLWLEGDGSKIKTGLQFAAVVYSAWLSEIVAKTYALDFKDQTVISIVSNLFYQSLFDNVEALVGEQDKQRMAIIASKATRAPAELVFEVIDKIEELHTIDDYCKAIQNCVENVRLKDFNLATLLTIIRNSWYGTNSKEIISVALEHPPTWACIVHTALAERTYKSSTIYRIAERFGKRGGADEYMSNFSLLLESMVVKEPKHEPVRPYA